MEGLASISQVFGYLLPIIGAVALIVLIVLLLNVNKMLKDVNVTVSKCNPVVDGVNDAVATTNGYLKDLKTTVVAVNNLSMSVEAVRATTERVVKNSASKINKQYDQVKEWVTDALEKREIAKKAEKQEVAVASAEKPAE